ncbi:unnamed protein product [Rotaria socialis]|nr:unnamed protein product [Rotaria socialis]
MQNLATTEKESSENWRRAAKDNYRLALQLEHDKSCAVQQRDEALHQIEQMRQLFVHNVRLLPSDHDLTKLSLDDIRSLQTQLQQELSKLSVIEQVKSNKGQQTPSAENSAAKPTTTTSSSPQHPK